MSSVRSERSGKSGGGGSVRSSKTSQTPHDSRPVKRSPSKQYRKIIAAEVASGDDYTFADQHWQVDLHSPVRLISYKALAEHMRPLVAGQELVSVRTRTRTSEHHRPVVAVQKDRTTSDATRTSADVDVVYGHPYRYSNEAGEEAIINQAVLHDKEQNLRVQIPLQSQERINAVDKDKRSSSSTEESFDETHLRDVMNGMDAHDDDNVIRQISASDAVTSQQHTECNFREEYDPTAGE